MPRRESCSGAKQSRLVRARNSEKPAIVAGEAATLPFWQSKFFYKRLDNGNELGIIITYKSLTPYGRLKMLNSFDNDDLDLDIDYDPSDEIERTAEFDEDDEYEDDDYYDDEDDEWDEDESESYYADREHRWLMDNFDEIY